MFRSLYAKLAAVMLALFAIVGILVAMVFVFSTEMYRQEVSQKLNRDLARNIIAEKLLIEDNKINYAALDEIIHMLMVINPAIEVYLLDQNGNILAFSADSGKVKRRRIDLGPVYKWLAGDMAIPLLGDDPRDPEGHKVFSAARIPPKGELEGYLYVILGGEEYDSAASMIRGSYILRLSVWLIVAALFFTLSAGLVIFALLTGRLRKLAAAMNAFKRGETPAGMGLPPPVTGELPGDEIDSFAQTFREMAARIEEQVAKLRKGDLLRRELVANVSHDLRTPLATLTAYIETLQLKENVLDAGERRRYLKVARNHCERLNALVSDLFELARLEGRETELQQEPFNLAELVQDVVQNYELTAREKEISLLSNIGRELPFVRGDIGLIARLLENLIINAMRYTPKGGTVSVILTPAGDRVTVQVLDTGAGIPKEALPHIFDRYYKAGGAESLPASFAGLGLAIAKRIIDLHGGVITVESEPDSGTCFSFSLPVQIAF